METIWGCMLQQYLQGSADQNLLTYCIWQKELDHRLGQCVYALYKNFKVIRVNS